MDPSIDDQLYFLNQNQNHQYLPPFIDTNDHHHQPQNIDDEPLYVNAKQYFRILKRRVARSRLEEVHRLSRQRKPYLHESRHKHAMRRPRGPGGRFLTAEEIAAQKRAEPSAENVEAEQEEPEEEEQPKAPEPGPSSSSADARMQTPLVEQHPEPLREQHHQQHQPQHHMPHHDTFFTPDLNPPTPYRPPSIPMPQQIPNLASHSHSHSHTGTGHHHHAHIRHAHNPPKPTYQFSPPIPSPYPAPPPQMHHVPHPHAHARHHHHLYLYGSDPVAPEMQRRSDDNMIQYGGQGPTN